ncbi:MAG TPA: MoaD/ThiS family protein [Actinomycetota bacterium]|nr:MoaD/ThiS family protein [Actinomycetota bacterium]
MIQHSWTAELKVKLRNPDRTVEISGPTTVVALLRELAIVPEAVLVIRDRTLLTRDEALREEDELEVRPVLSGGSLSARNQAPRGARGGSDDLPRGNPDSAPGGAMRPPEAAREKSIPHLAEPLPQASFPAGEKT